MKCESKARVGALALLLLFNGSILWSSTTHAASGRLGGEEPLKAPVTVADSIAMTQIGQGGYLDLLKGNHKVVVFSHDHTQFALVTHRGNLGNNTTEFSLLVFQTTKMFKEPPQVVATLASSSNREAISDITWLGDNDTIVFLGEQSAQQPQVYKVSVSSGVLEAMTKHTTPVVAYQINQAGDRLVYIARLETSITATATDTSYRVTANALAQLYGHADAVDTRMEIYVKTPDAQSAKREGGIINAPSDPALIDMQLSRDGNYALVNAYDTEPSDGWETYAPRAGVNSARAACKSSAADSCPQAYLLIDLIRGEVSPLLNSPIVPPRDGARGMYAWTEDDHVLLVNALLPLNVSDTTERIRRQTNFYAADVAVPGREIVLIGERAEPFPAEQIASKENDLFVTSQAVGLGGKRLQFLKKKGKWTWGELSAREPQYFEPPIVIVNQGINAPPRVLATDPYTKRKRVVLDLNPQFAKLTFGRVEHIEIKANAGYDTGGLIYYPPHFRAGRRYPMVIQTHGFPSDRFWIDGPYTTAFAAQALANKDIVVLQLDMGSNAATVESIWNTPMEAPQAVATFEAGIDELDRRGLIDREHVGITGFSRTVYHVLSALTSSKYHFEAAVVADGVDFGYSDCVSYIGEEFQRLCARMNGDAPPYGAGLAGWKKAAPTFNLDRLQAALLLQAISGPVGEWEIYAGLKWLRKPVELLSFYPEGEHELVKPRERLASQQTTVDWYCFWLKGEEDHDSSKESQYVRWRELRKL